jgi:hypothetical protein
MPEDDLTDLEQRLAACAPSTAGLDADAMLFAAGRASARTRVFWPLLSAGLATLTVALGVWLANERSTSRELAENLRQTPPPASIGAPAFDPTSSSETAPLLAMHRALEEGRDPWPPQSVIVVEPGASPLSPALGAHSLDRLLDQ